MHTVTAITIEPAELSELAIALEHRLVEAERGNAYVYTDQLGAMLLRALAALDPEDPEIDETRDRLERLARSGYTAAGEPQPPDRRQNPEYEPSPAELAAGVWVNPYTHGVESTSLWLAAFNAGEPAAHRALSRLCDR